jgi:hypothetical protein
MTWSFQKVLLQKISRQHLKGKNVLCIPVYILHCIQPNRIRFLADKFRTHIIGTLQHWFTWYADRPFSPLCQIHYIKNKPSLTEMITSGEWIFFFFLIFSSPCQRQCELLPSLGVRRLSSVNFSHFNLLLWNPSAKWTET